MSNPLIKYILSGRSIKITTKPNVEVIVNSGQPHGKLLHYLRVGGAILSLMITIVVATSGIVGYLMSSQHKIELKEIHSKHQAQVQTIILDASQRSATIQAKSDQKDDRLIKLEFKLSNYRGLLVKERFLALYVRFYMSRLAGLDPEYLDFGPPMDHELAASNLENYIREQVALSDDPSRSANLDGVLIGKSGANQRATIKFVYDGSIWPIPDRFKVYSYGFSGEFESEEEAESDSEIQR